MPLLRHCEPTDRAKARPMTGSAKQSRATGEDWIASSQVLLAMTGSFRSPDERSDIRVFGIPHIAPLMRATDSIQATLPLLRYAAYSPPPCGEGSGVGANKH